MPGAADRDARVGAAAHRDLLGVLRHRPPAPSVVILGAVLAQRLRVEVRHDHARVHGGPGELRVAAPPEDGHPGERGAGDVGARAAQVGEIERRRLDRLEVAVGDEHREAALGLAAADGERGAAHPVRREPEALAQRARAARDPRRGGGGGASRTWSARALRRKEAHRVGGAELGHELVQHEARVDRFRQPPREELVQRERVLRTPRLDVPRARCTFLRATRELRDPRVHARRERLERVAGGRRELPPLLFGETAKVEQPRELIGLDRVRADLLSRRAARAAPQVDQLREPILRLAEAQREERVGLARGIDVRHAVAVAVDADGVLDPGHGHCLRALRARRY